VKIFGVSFDSVEDNKKFAEKFNFPYPLLSDPSRDMGVAFGAADKKDSKYAKRVAYLVENGKITHAYDVKDPTNHAAQVLKDLAG
jgi:peroxiredoxin Q/BCP